MSSQQEQVMVQDGYQFAAQPKPMKQKGKYRDPNEEAFYQQKGSKSFNQSKSEQNYESDDGFQRNTIQAYMEELDDPIEDETQLVPDYYVDKPPTPEYKPKEKGLDVHTQIEDGELFDFKIEVEPILQVIVGKTVEQARMELIEQFEKEELQKHKEAYIKKRNAELMVTQRMEQQYVRKKEEGERRNIQHKLWREQKKQAHKKLISRLLSKQALQGVSESILEELEDQGYLKDSIKSNIQLNFFPWLLNQTIKEINEIGVHDLQLDKNIISFKDEVQNKHKDHLKKEADRRQGIIDERERIRLEKEEYKRKKNEWKRKMALQEERGKILQSLETKLINTSIKIENIFESQLADINGDFKGQQPCVCLFGGFIGQIGIALSQILALQNKDALTQEEVFNIITKLLKDFLKYPISLDVHESIKDQFDQYNKLMDEDLVQFNQVKPQILQEILDQKFDEFRNKITLRFLMINGLISETLFNQILHCILDLYFKSITFKEKVEEPPQHVEGEEQKENPAENEEHVKPVDKSINKSLVLDKSIQHEVTQHDQSMMAAKQKIIITFGQETNYLKTVKSILRIRTPYFTQEELDQERLEQEKLLQEQQQQSQDQQQLTQEQQEQQKQVMLESEILDTQEEEEKERAKKCKYDVFVDVYDGEGYRREKKKLDRTSRQKDLREDQPGQFVFATTEHRPLIYDEKAHYFFRVAFLKYLKEQFPDKFNDVNEEEFIAKCNSVDKITEDEKEFFINFAELGNIPIFDYQY